MKLCPSLHQKRRTLRSSEKSKRSVSGNDSVANDQVKTRLSKSQADAEEITGHCDWFILPLHFRFRFRQSGFQVIGNDGVSSGVRR